MAEEYISRKAVRDAIASLSIERFELTPAYRLYIEALDNVDKKVVKIPAADVEPVRHGRWLDTYGDSWKCSVCGVESYVDEDWRKSDDKAYQMNYCHYCGAKMDGGIKCG